MSKRSISEVSNPVENIFNKKQKTENNRPENQKEVDVLMESLHRGIDEIKRNKSRNLKTFQEEIDQLIIKFSNAIQTLNETYFTRKDFKKIEMIYFLENKELVDYLNNYIQGNKYIPRDFYLKNTSKIIQELLHASQTSLGKLISEHYPSWQKTISNKIKQMSIPHLSENNENVKEVKELRYYANKISRQIKI